uniref:Uncharacterized protein n=1 Tax=Oryza sativa subsp. japonica TaxID=39947 RepID=Q6ZH01_ORYSJ|nr:hypothetical protein [Oryza sativa Japonica Group]
MACHHRHPVGQDVGASPLLQLSLQKAKGERNRKREKGEREGGGRREGEREDDVWWKEKKGRRKGTRGRSIGGGGKPITGQSPWRSIAH